MPFISVRGRGSAINNKDAVFTCFITRRIDIRALGPCNAADSWELALPKVGSKGLNAILDFNANSSQGCRKCSNNNVHVFALRNNSI